MRNALWKTERSEGGVGSLRLTVCSCSAFMAWPFQLVSLETKWPSSSRISIVQRPEPLGSRMGV